jgi:hypothetical protein
MSAATSAKALAQAKVRRQKQIVAVGSVILLALVGYQLPKLLGGSSSSAPAPLSTVPVTPSAPLAAAPGKLPDTDKVSSQPQYTKLESFSLFKSKDPFVQQLSTNVPPPASAPATADPTGQGAGATPPSPADQGLTPATTPASTVPFPAETTSATTTPATTTPGSTTPGSTTPVSTTPAVAPTSVLISTNGVCETVNLQGTFPQNENIFRVVWIAKDGKSVKVAVVGGSYDSGEAATTLKMGQTLTLVNTADGTRYVIALKTKCDAQSQPAPATPTTTTSSPVPPAPTTTATTPIVPDSLDGTTTTTITPPPTTTTTTGG